MGMHVNGVLEATCLSSKTISDWVKFIQKLLGDSVDFDDTMIGGKYIVIEIDEMNLGKRKYDRGHRVDGVWVVAGIQRIPENRCFAVEVDNRDSPTMCRILSEFVRPGSIIHTDMWNTYKNPCIELGFDHKIIDHPVTFKDPVTSVHTDTIEGLNNGLKYQIKARNRTKKDNCNHLLYIFWKRINKKKKWPSFLEAFKNTEYI
ncbi:hypothetical protein RF11_07432 [Thelohanellus kitauei]|uniref:ISXO2-like transposase domain-containing protein n=1 Tax=Thelohanellus kitauei TaxID=669202 RepID=A0A0C2NEX4_THEKT|nr:hypothetical protein RF11_07432 [Thelohanellus kitauei]